MDNEKNLLRNKGKSLLESVREEKRNELSLKLTNHVIHTSWWKEATTIGITISMEHEWNTRYLIEAAWKEGKKVGVPKCFPKDNHKMVFYHFTDFKDLEKVYFGLFEPNPNKSKLVTKEEIELLFVPGLLFDSKGFRIGYGGGYYDRYLKGFEQTSLSIAMEKQIITNVPRDQYDQPVKHIITENGVLF
ncbi:5-formyltetrahydrofolate cyclo-ligase [Salirhabdus euzebyi]|uniref:5-formyltetrahydrofolate cyclo-ligase n=1 Tax=Salirhabdus euzebyi TaxID=394506 RepID=A0A841Q7C2_9BACI|nr:5-formyltetrahydrofolate cyclo-ligase [Salirhabdus euzebyi]MBB6454275.1 5-formyltetrahydrofolate cyclo-ligase [Salirhabdus euzebyi]